MVNANIIPKLPLKPINGAWAMLFSYFVIKK